MASRRLAIGVAAALSLCWSHAHAEGGSGAAAEALFRQARVLLEEGRTAEACDKFSESQRLDPSSGTAINLAACFETQGKTASAWATYLVAARLAESQQKTERAEEGKRKASEIEKKLSYLTVTTDKVPGLQVRVGGVLLEQSSIGVKLPTDPGEIVVEASAPGYKTATAKVTLASENDAQVLALPKLEKLPDGPVTAKPETPTEKTSHTTGTATTTGADTGNEPSRTVPLVIGGAGIAFVALGGVFGVLALSSNSEAKSLCNNRTTECPPSALTRQDTAYAQANAANVLVGVGVAAIATSAVWLLVSGGERKSPTAAAWHLDGHVGPGAIGASVRGGF